MLSHTFFMKLGRMGATSLSLVALMGLGGCDATQPRTQCKVQPSDYAARYEVVGEPQGTCTDEQILTAEVLHMQSFIPDRTKKGSKPSVAIESASVADAVDAIHEVDHDKDVGVEYSQGYFTTVLPGKSLICSAPSFDMDTSIDNNGTTLSYSWSNLKSYVRPDFNGAYFGADLTRVDGDCTVTYKVTAIFPVLPCGSTTDPDSGNNTTDGDPDDSVCQGLASHDTETNLLPQIGDYHCDAHQKICVTGKTFPDRTK